MSCSERRTRRFWWSSCHLNPRGCESSIDATAFGLTRDGSGHVTRRTREFWCKRRAAAENLRVPPAVFSDADSAASDSNVSSGWGGVVTLSGSISRSAKCVIIVGNGIQEFIFIIQCIVMRVESVINELLWPLGLFAKVLYIFPFAINETIPHCIVRFKISQFIQLFVRYLVTVRATFIKEFPIASESQSFITDSNNVPCVDCVVPQRCRSRNGIVSLITIAGRHLVVRV